jgi:hypothetical protein
MAKSKQEIGQAEGEVESSSRRSMPSSTSKVKPSSSHFDRERDLRDSFNAFLTESLHLRKRDYYSILGVRGLLRLKAALNQVNNIITMKLTMSFIDWLVYNLHLDSDTKRALEDTVRRSKANSNGFDVRLDQPVQLLGEVKCNLPINGGLKYGTAQRNGIEKDIHALLHGKGKTMKSTEPYLKFMAFLDLPEVRAATKDLITPKKRNSKSEQHNRKLLFLKNTKTFNRKDVVYGVYVSLGHLARSRHR